MAAQILDVNFIAGIQIVDAGRVTGIRFGDTLIGMCGRRALIQWFRIVFDDVTVCVVIIVIEYLLKKYNVTRRFGKGGCEQNGSYLRIDVIKSVLFDCNDSLMHVEESLHCMIIDPIGWFPDK